MTRQKKRERECENKGNVKDEGVVFDKKYLMRSNKSGKQNTLAFLLTIITPDEVSYICGWMNWQTEGGTEGRWRGETKQAYVDEYKKSHI